MHTAGATVITFSVEVITLPVSDVDRALRFYVDRVGFTLENDRQLRLMARRSTHHVYPRSHRHREARRHDTRGMRHGGCCVSNVCHRLRENKTAHQRDLARRQSRIRDLPITMEKLL